jgi:peptidoglycan/LPS O-acetylase OafA/YrhL
MRMSKGGLTMQESRFLALDALRGIGALLVVFSHLWIFSWEDGTAAGLDHLGLTPHYIKPFADLLHHCYLDLGRVAVALFFLISGYVMAGSIGRYSAMQFLVRRAWRLYPTYAAGLCLGCVVLYTQGAPPSWPQILVNLSLMRDLTLLPAIDRASWFLEVEVKGCLIVAVLLAWGGHARLFQHLAIVLPLATIATMFIALMGNNMVESYITSACQLLGWCSWLSIGIVLAQPKPRVQYGGLIGVFFAIFIVMGLAQPGVIGGVPTHFTSSAVAALIFLITLRYGKNWHPPVWLLWLGSISYSLYVSHTLLGYAIIGKVYTLTGNTELALAVATASVLMAGWAVHRLVELRVQH